MTKFTLGQIVATPGFLDIIETVPETAIDLLKRHLVLDSDVCEEDTVSVLKM